MTAAALLPDLSRGALLVGAPSATLTRAAQFAHADPQVTVVDVRAFGHDALVQAGQRFRAAGCKLVVVATSRDDVPDGLLRNLDHHLDV